MSETLEQIALRVVKENKVYLWEGSFDQGVTRFAALLVAALGAQEPVGTADGFGMCWWKDRPPQDTKLYSAPQVCPVCTQAIDDAAKADEWGFGNKSLAYELMGIAADVDAGKGFDIVCRKTLQRVIDALAAPQLPQREGWLLIDTQPDDTDQTYLVANSKGQVAPCIRGVIHGNTGTEWDWDYGECITHRMPLPAAPKVQP